LAIIDKRRSGHNVADSLTVIGDVAGKTAVLIDDMIDTGGTICQGAKLLRQRGAARARRLGVDCLFLSPLFPTQSHPGAPSLGGVRWSGLARGLPAPCIALGGITAARLGAVPRRAVGVAAIGGLTPVSVASRPQ
jgi:hypothetical protein